MPSPPVPAVTLHSVRERLAPVGLNLVGATTAEAFDRSQPAGRRVQEITPSCGTLLVVGSGGRAFWQRMREETGEPSKRPQTGYQPISERCARLSGELRAWFAALGMRCEIVCPEQNPALNFRQMAEMAGIGVVSPVSEWLMHPEFGPWISVRFAVLLEGKPLGAAFQRPAGDFQPCAGCRRPCENACPVHACNGGRFDVQRCATHRHTGGCEDACAMKHACPVGVEHRYDPAEEHFRHASALFGLQRQYGLGWWRLVPKSMRPQA